MYEYHENELRTSLDENQIFVFGSNLAGVHKAGASKQAIEFFGAQTGCGKGMSGKSYAIPTANQKLKPLPLADIQRYVEEFKKYVLDHPKLVFYILPIGCGRVGYQAEDIAPLFIGISKNVVLPHQFVEIIEVIQNSKSQPKLKLFEWIYKSGIAYQVADEIENTFTTQLLGLTKFNALDRSLLKIACKQRSYPQLSDIEFDELIAVLRELDSIFFFETNSEGPLLRVSKLWNLIKLYDIEIEDFKTLWSSKYKPDPYAEARRIMGM
ncbi:A1S_2505 family phage non-structural protein [Acinetobacter indicus]|uniref:A1S_2505 family phage non-structural protein n=1 Tax=Acinetobacter indicus TaxID=756892 RepID=UPI000CEB8D04|nr:hypothetical protein [Acinetobacter indicus]